MASTKRCKVVKIISDGYAPASTALLSSAIEVIDQDNLTFQVNALSGDAISATITVQGSLDFAQVQPSTTPPTVLNAGHWFNLPTVPSSVTISGVSTVGFTVQPMSCPYIQLTITEGAASDGYFDAYLGGHSI